MAIPLADAVSVTGATTGQVPCEIEVNIQNLTAAQKTALVAFITSLGAGWPSAPGHIWGLSVSRRPFAPATVDCSIRGVIVHPNAATAVTQQTAGTVTHIIGIAP